MGSIHSLFFFVLAIAVLVAFHEFGHFWVARKTGVKVIRFSIGFGKSLFSWKNKNNSTEFVIAAIPLGGYVKMVDEREGQVSEEDLPYAFNRQSVWVRSAIVAAGPVFNLVLAVLLFWIILVIGESGIKPIVGKIDPSTLMSKAGFEERDEILSINEKPTPTWTIALDELLSQALDGQQTIVVKVKTYDDEEKIRVLVLTEDDVKTPETLHKKLGVKPWSPLIEPIIGNIVSGDVAENSGFKTGDVIVDADGHKFAEWQQWVNYVQSKGGSLIKVNVMRDGVEMAINVIPRVEILEDGRAIGKIGAGVQVPRQTIDAMRAEYSYPLPDAFILAIGKTWFYSISTVKMIGKMFIGSASVDNLSGPISIAQYAGQSAEMGFTSFLRFLAIVSISLGVLNLLPVPVLDGGHLLFYLIEGIKGSPVSDSVQIAFQKLGMVLLFLLMSLAMFLDLGRLFK